MSPSALRTGGGNNGQVVLSNFAYLDVGPARYSNHSQHDDVASNRVKRRTKREHSLSDAFSKNITMILEDLLKDYDKTERPAYNKGITKKSIFFYLQRPNPDEQKI